MSKEVDEERCPDCPTYYREAVDAEFEAWLNSRRATMNWRAIDWFEDDLKAAFAAGRAAERAELLVQSEKQIVRDSDLRNHGYEQGQRMERERCLAAVEEIARSRPKAAGDEACALVAAHIRGDEGDSE